MRSCGSSGRKPNCSCRALRRSRGSSRSARCLRVPHLLRQSLANLPRVRELVQVEQKVCRCRSSEVEPPIRLRAAHRSADNRRRRGTPHSVQRGARRSDRARHLTLKRSAFFCASAAPGLLRETQHHGRRKAKLLLEETAWDAEGQLLGRRLVLRARLQHLPAIESRTPFEVGDAVPNSDPMVLVEERLAMRPVLQLELEHLERRPTLAGSARARRGTACSVRASRPPRVGSSAT